jgi:hypothetical protein
MIWALCWAALSGAGWLLHSGAAPDMQNPAHDLPSLLPSMILGAAGQFCLYRGIRSGVGEVWDGLWGRKAEPAATKPQHRFDALEEQGSDFDADAAFARYMERRRAEKAEANEEEAPVARRPIRRDIPRLHPQPGGFGRKAYERSITPARAD